MSGNKKGKFGHNHRKEWLYGRRPVLEALRAGRREFLDLSVSDTARDATSEE